MLCIMHRERIVSLLFPLHSRRSQANHYPQGNLTRTVHDPISTIASFRKNLVNDALVTLCDVSRPRERRKDSIPRALSTYCGRVPHVPLFIQNRCYTTSRDGDEEWDPSQLENSPATEFDVEETMEQSAPAQPSSVLEDGEGGGGEEAEEEGTGLEDVEHPSEDASSVTRTRDEERIVHPTTATSPTLYVPTPDPSSPASEAGKSSSSSSSSSTSPPTEHIDVPQIDLRPCEAPPSRFETFSGTKVYKWSTIAKYGRRLIGPMREWADEFKYRTGITLQWEPVAPERVLLREYPHRDSVDVDVYLFGSDRAVENSMGLLQEMVQQEPCYVRCAIYRGQGPALEWLTLRRINHDTRPPDIPPISLKTPGKWTLLFETRKEAVLRTVFEETGIHLEESALTYTGLRQDGDVEYFWRVPVHYYVAQLPPEAEVLGPQTALNDYFTAWDARILMQSPDPIDRTWAATADPTTGCAWLATSKIDELQLPIRGEDYMRSRYLPAPHLIELRNALGWAL